VTSLLIQLSNSDASYPPIHYSIPTNHNHAVSTLEMDFKFVMFFVQMAGVTMAHMIRVTNNCPFIVWTGIQGNTGQQHLENGGFSVDAYKTHFILASRTWAGRIWGRTNCDSKGKCETGDCGKSMVDMGVYGRFITYLLRCNISLTCLNRARILITLVITYNI